MILILFCFGCMEEIMRYGGLDVQSADRPRSTGTKTEFTEIT